MSNLWTTREAADRLKLSFRTIQRLCRDGRIRAVLISQEWRITEQELQRIEREGVPRPPRQREG